MKTSQMFSAGLFAIATLAAGSASAKIINQSYYPPGEDFVQHTSLVSRAEMKAQTRAANQQIQARQPRTEFGAGSHDKSPEVFSPSDVKTDAAHFTRVGAHVPFSY